MSDSPPPEFSTRVAAEVQRLRATGLTVEEIARRAGVSRSVLYRYIGGGMPETPSRLYALARTFGCSMDYLWGRAPERSAIYRADEVVIQAAEAMIQAAGELQQAFQVTGR